MQKIKEILVLHHTHTDIGYTHTQPAYWELSRRFIDEAIDLCEQTADWPDASRMRWTCEVTAPVLDWLERASDRQIERLDALVRNRQIAFGGMYCNVTALYSAEQLAQSLYPVRLLRELFGAPVSVAINQDVNGLPWSIVGLLRDADIKALLMSINVHFGGFPLHRPLLFNWEGPDGRTLPVFNGEHYNAFSQKFILANESPTTDSMAQGLAKYLKELEKQSYPYDFIYLTATHPHHFDNNPPDPHLPQMIRQWNDEERDPVIKMVTPEMLFERLNQVPADLIPTHRGDWTDYWTFGCFSTVREVATNRQARAALLGAQALGTLLPDHPRQRQMQREVFSDLCMGDEHTWGAFSSTQPLRDPTINAGQWHAKANVIYQAHSMAKMLMRDRLETLSQNPVQGSGTKQVLFYNPSNVKRRQVLRLHNSFLDNQWKHFNSNVHFIYTQKEILSEADSKYVGPIDLEPMEVKTIAVDDLKAAPIPKSVSVSKNSCETSSFRLQFDPTSGRITSLYDRQLDRELIDNDSQWDLFGPVRESLAEETERATKSKDPRESFWGQDMDVWMKGQDGWNTQWKSRLEVPETLLNAEVKTTPLGSVFTRTWNGPGPEEITQTITLLEYEQCVRFEAFFNKVDEHYPESLYFTFPLEITDWRVHFDTAGHPTEYFVDQLDGGLRDWFTADSWVAAHNQNSCVTLACPDAPLFQVGGFHFGRQLKKKPNGEKALLLAWPMNNYWNTNFQPSQPGYTRLRYELKSAPRFDQAETTRFSNRVMHPIEYHPIVNADNPVYNGKLIELEGEGLILLQIKPAEDNDDMIVRVSNHSQATQNAILSLPNRSIEVASTCDTLELPKKSLHCDGNQITWPIRPGEISSVRLSVKA
jgi:alpha-mannosidase